MARCASRGRAENVGSGEVKVQGMHALHACGCSTEQLIALDGDAVQPCVYAVCAGTEDQIG